MTYSKSLVEIRITMTYTETLIVLHDIYEDVTVSISDSRTIQNASLLVINCRGHIQLNDNIIMNDMLEKTWKKARWSVPRNHP